MRGIPISKPPILYTDVNKSEMVGYKSGNISKVFRTYLFQKSELYAILMVLLDFPESLNIATDFQFAQRVFFFTNRNC